MILLEQVSIASLKKYASYGYFLGKGIIKNNQEELQSRIYELICKYNITNYHELKNLIESGNPDFNILFLKNHIIYVEKILSRLNERNVSPILYPCNNYEGFDYDRDTLLLTDNSVTGDKLLFVNPLTDGMLKRKLEAYTIHDLKMLLNQVAIVQTYGLNKNNGQNAFVNHSYDFGDDYALKIKNMINFYEEQVMRQAIETGLTDVNLFALNKEVKSRFVEEQINEIIEYLLDSAEVCVWGELSKTSKDNLSRVLKNSVSYKAINAKYGLIDAISDYTTLSEVEEGLVRKRTIDRFIVK